MDRVRRKGPRGLLALGALGVVFGDIGTSPLYTLPSAFALGPGLRAEPVTVLGLVSLIIWTLTLIVTWKYVTLVLRASDDGEGGILVLASLVRTITQRQGRIRLARAALLAGVVGAALFVGDSIITPAISVLSAVEGLAVTGFGTFSLPLAVVVLSALFLAQHKGTGKVGSVFGPIMALWFVSLAALGIPHLIARPEVLLALSPTSAATFMAQQPIAAFVALGAVVLSITGAEALYADLGHFGTGPIRLAWLGLVYPSLVVNYLGQGALILQHPGEDINAFFHLAPASLRLPLVGLATIATIIASQSVISGTFSMCRQASGLGFLPRLVTRSTSGTHSGQIYLPAINSLLFVGVLGLVLGFRTSSSLAAAYGLAVTSTFLLTTSLLLILARRSWGWSRFKVALVGVPLLWLEGSFVGSNLLKIPNGGWLPIVVAILLVAAMTNWHRGQLRVNRTRHLIAGPLGSALTEIGCVPRTVGTTVYAHRQSLKLGPTTAAPLALALNLKLNHAASEQILIIHVDSLGTSRVADEERVTLDDIAGAPPGVHHATLRFGFHEERDVPSALLWAQEHGGLPASLNLGQAHYATSSVEVESAGSLRSRMSARVFQAVARLSARPAQQYHLPLDRTIDFSMDTTLLAKGSSDYW